MSKALALPKMEIGCHYQGILGQTYSGIHIGILLLLWKSKNTVKLQKAKLVYTDNAISDHANEHYYEMKQLYGQYKSLKGILEEYQKINGSMFSIQLLDKALAAGQISVLEYFVELNYYNNSYNSFLEIEKEYYVVVALLLNYQF
ncbi:hypothetical protein FQU23_008780 [Flavobacterium sp. XN-5]|uniref:hypothetical protein n=1 Tax=Flavobacterium sp. XN-5 TaxID=2599390 RepID=UPI0011CC1B08|nr:hypothetical protein [Flavobacterium sp. XN-5]NGY37607.1 hypothetical protein [Flavobacterium sp. XN-5]